MRPVRTAVVSDLHLGGLAGADVAREGRPLAALVEAISDVDRLVLLGDVVELRERPLAEALEVTRPVFEEIGRAMAGRPVVLVPGNHDHALAEPWLARLRLAGDELPAETDWPVEPGDGAAARIAACMPDSELTLAYPGLRLREDVYATHGHYLDLHLTIPRLESIAASAMGRLTKLRRSARSAADYEIILAPLYAFYAGLAQGASAGALARGSSFSRTVWRRASDGRAPDAPSADPAAVPAGGPANARERASAAATRFLLGRITIPGAVGDAERARPRPVPSDSHRARSSAARDSRRWRRWPRRSRRARRTWSSGTPTGRARWGARRPRRVDDALGHATLEQRQLAARGSVPARRPREPLLAGHGRSRSTTRDRPVSRTCCPG